jgi:hypothetical protein
MLPLAETVAVTLDVSEPDAETVTLSVAVSEPEPEKEGVAVRLPDEDTELLADNVMEALSEADADCSKKNGNEV